MTTRCSPQVDSHTTNTAVVCWTARTRAYTERRAEEEGEALRDACDRN